MDITTYVLLKKKIDSLGISDTKILEVVETFLLAHPEYIGATDEQVAQIAANAAAIQKLQAEAVVIVTLDEYNAFTEEQKKEKVYLIWDKDTDNIKADLDVITLDEYNTLSEIEKKKRDYLIYSEEDISIDEVLDENSIRPVQNKVITKEINKVKKSVSDALASGITDDQIRQSVEQYLEKNPVQVITDNTLSVAGTPADALATGTAIDSLKGDLEVSFKKTNSRNLFNYIKINNGYYLNQNGVSTENSAMSFIEDYFSVDENTNYVLSRYNKENKTYITGANAIISYYNNDKEFFSYKQLIDKDRGKFTTPLNCKYIRISGKTTWFADELLQLEKGTIPTNYVEYKVKMTLSEEAIPNNIENKTVINHLIVKKDGTGNFTKIQDAINSIKNNSEKNQYIIHVHEGEYNIGEDFTEDDLKNKSFSGVFVPDYCTLKGEGNRENIVLYVELEEKNRMISALNLRNTSTLENLTVKGTKTKYCIHDDFAMNNISYQRRVKNCKFIAIDTNYNSCYGSGCKEGADWEFENCIFDASQCNDTDGKIAFLNHNNTKWEYSSAIKFINCKFIGKYVANKNGPITLRTLNNNSNNMETNVSLYGCDLGGGIVLKEESKDVYGSGILFKINGFANKNLEYSITSTDGKDYSGNINLIN